PLSAISGYAALLASGMNGPLSDEQQHSVERIRLASRELLRLINDILSFSQLDSGRVEVRMETMPVASAVERADALIRLRIEEAGLSFRAHDCEEAEIVADPDRLQQVLLNLLTNAVKFTPSGGAISIGCERAGDRVRIHVRDTGIGIAPEQLGRIFEPFVQLDPGAVQRGERGVGLGLAISRELTQAMDGDLTAVSAPGAGSTFTIDLRAAPAR
ncbi:MAG TPA: HAMP domain-containing sensor histidine kinase, partial [Thermoanaerobaculia bacterium]|nr:HAMP domain-containing sensor histidine kinase [Thermoanaerobaculia bacterium]